MQIAAAAISKLLVSKLFAMLEGQMLDFQVII
jgi:hypothetical protein